MLPQAEDGVGGGGRPGRGGSKHSLGRTTAATTAQGCLKFQSDGVKTKAAHACGQAGRKGRVEANRGDAARRLQSGSRARRG